MAAQLARLAIRVLVERRLAALRVAVVEHLRVVDLVLAAGL
jgi:hypothetical protein